MESYLMTVDGTERIGAMLRVSPRIPISTLIAREPDLMMPMPGDALQLRLPGGDVRAAEVGLLGVETWARDGNLYTDSDPADPLLTLSIAGDLRPDEVPAGTEVWLVDPQYRG